MKSTLIQIYYRLPTGLRNWVKRTSRGIGPLGQLLVLIRYRNIDKYSVVFPENHSKLRVLFGPLNTASQASEWSRALEAESSEIQSASFSGVGSVRYNSAADFQVERATYLFSQKWHREFELFLSSQTHIFYESALPLLGRMCRADAFREARFLSKNYGTKIAFVYHGSDIRLPSLHLKLEPSSPFAHQGLPITVLEDQAQEIITKQRASGFPSFVTTLDLLDYLPEAEWLPLSINPEDWFQSRAVLVRDRPIVVHAPTNAAMKGSNQIAKAMQALHDTGVIEYRLISGVSHDEMKNVYKDADIVLEQFLLGSYGVTACEAMAAGCLVVGNVNTRVREELRKRTGFELPIVQSTAAGISETVKSIVSKREEMQLQAVLGQKFVASIHNGRFAAEQLRIFLAS
ncbi:MAG: hypothetical protein WBA28_00385 [Microbacteriaceae bacterium]